MPGPLSFDEDLYAGGGDLPGHFHLSSRARVFQRVVDQVAEDDAKCLFVGDNIGRRRLTNQ